METKHVEISGGAASEEEAATTLPAELYLWLRKQESI
jgi:hypothetical protein